MLHAIERLQHDACIAQRLCATGLAPGHIGQERVCTHTPDSTPLLMLLCNSLLALDMHAIGKAAPDGQHVCMQDVLVA